MGGVTCRCGSGVKDNTDCLPYKAYLIADQDFQDYERTLRSANPQWSHHFVKATVYQCPSCGRLIYVPTKGESILTFSPDAPSPGVLRSVMGGDWKRSLRGRWSDVRNEGSVEWGDTGAGDEDNGFVPLKSWEAVEAMYHEVFLRLTKANQLRNAMLSRNGRNSHWETVHRWVLPETE